MSSVAYSRCLLLAAMAVCIWGCAPSEKSQLDSQQELIAKQIEEQRSMAISYYVDAMMLNDLSDHQEALKKLDMATELDNGFTLAYSMKGDIYQKLQDYPASAAAYEKATELDPWSFKDFFNLGGVYEVMTEWVKAVKAYVAACNLDATHYQAHYKAAKCYYELKDYQPSKEYAQKAKAIDPNQAETEILLGDLLGLEKNHTEAIDSYRRALELEGNNPKVMVSLAAAYLRTSRFSAAKELLTDVLAGDPNNGLACQYMGFAQLKLKETDLAVENYKKAVQINDNDWMAHKGLGVAYMLQSIKNNDEKLKALAMEQWGISLQIKPDQPELKKLTEKYAD